MLQSFYPLVARGELDEETMPVEFMQDRRLEFLDYSTLKPFAVNINDDFSFLKKKKKKTVIQPRNFTGNDKLYFACQVRARLIHVPRFGIVSK